MRSTAEPPQSPPTPSAPPYFSSALLNHSLDKLHNLTTMVNTHSSTNDTDDERNESLADIEVAISATILVLAVVGNSIVVVSLTMKKGKLSRMHLMMLHLSLADLSVAFFQVLPQMIWDITYRFQGGAFLCGAVKYLQIVTMYASAYVLLSTAVDRYVAICRPFLSQKWTSRHAHLMVMVAWLASLIFSLPQVFIFSLKELEEGSGVHDCWANFDPPWTLKLYIIWNTLSVFIAPSLTLAVLYGHISYAVWSSSKMAENNTPRYTPHSTRNNTARQHTCNTSTANDLKQGKTAWHHGASRTVADSRCSPSDVGIGQPTGASMHTSTSAVALKSSLNADHEEASMKQTDLSNFDRRKYPTDASHSSSSSADLTTSTRLLVGQGHVTGRARAGPIGISRAKIKTFKLTLTVVVCYLMCWTPFYVAQLWAAFDENVPYDNIFFTLVLLLASVNSCTNPWIYMAFSDTICNSLRAIASSLACCDGSSKRKDGVGRDRGYAQSRSSAGFNSRASNSAYTSCRYKTNGVSRL